MARIIGLVDPDEFSLCFTRWCNEVQHEKLLETIHIAIDGKSLKGTYDNREKKCLTHMVNAYSFDTGLVFGQLITSSKSNEITTIQELLKLLRVKGRVISLDAMGCQCSIAELIVDRKGDYVISVKDNQPSLHKVFTDNFSLGQLSDYSEYAYEEEEIGKRGRKVLRSYIVILFTEKFGDFTVKWKGLKSLCVAATYQQKKGDDSRSVGIRYFISSKK
ncbi:putative transposase yncI [Vibrio scophthalmi LMG 19158]|uniref:Putative transposase yncI n=2 Tax=Vibrio scophthalmi TaxID=45658 RepID=F9RR16_9VIBR|nr:putative transposase yncI [Vibrio scophthalmi LMG 19158]